MIHHTKAYLRYKEACQDEFDMALLFCHAIPVLKVAIKHVAAGTVLADGTMLKTPGPDYFTKPSPHDRLIETTTNYRKKVGRMIFLATFSYFEAYFQGAVEELFQFHKSAEEWRSIARSRSKQADLAVQCSKYLAEYPKRNKRDKYRKYIGNLTQIPDFQFPSERLAAFGILQLQEVIDKKCRAVDIEMVAKDALGIELSAQKWEIFHKYRQRRNEVAHGQVKPVELKEAINASKHLFNMAKSIDIHIVKHFLLLECT